MAASVQDVLSDAKKLANRLKKYDVSTDTLLAKAQTLEKTVESMKEYHDELNHLSRVHPQIPRSSLIMAVQKESKQLQALERENRDLRITLNDYANALELIMSKYRQQVSQLIQSNHHHHYHHSHSHYNHQQHPNRHNNKSSHQNGKLSADPRQQPEKVVAVAGAAAATTRHGIESQDMVKRLIVNTDSPNISSSSSSSYSLDCYQRAERNADQLVNQLRDKIIEMAAVMMKAVDLDGNDYSREHEVLVQLRTENEGLRELLSITKKNGNLVPDISSQQASVATTADDGNAGEDETGNSGTGTMIPKKKMTTKEIAIQTDP